MRNEVKELRAAAHHFAASAADAARHLTCNPYPEPNHAWRWLRGIGYARHLMFTAVARHQNNGDEPEPVGVLLADVRTIAQRTIIPDELLSSTAVQQLLVEAATNQCHAPPRLGVDVSHQSDGLEVLAWRVEIRLVTTLLSKTLQIRKTSAVRVANQLANLTGEADAAFKLLLADVDRAGTAHRQAVEQVAGCFAPTVESVEKICSSINRNEGMAPYGITDEDIYLRSQFAEIWDMQSARPDLPIGVI